MNTTPQEAAPYQVPKPVAETLLQVSKLINTVITSIADGTATTRQAELFLDYFIDMSFAEREEIYRDFKEDGMPVLQLISAGQ